MGHKCNGVESYKQTRKRLLSSTEVVPLNLLRRGFQMDGINPLEVARFVFKSDHPDSICMLRLLTFRLFHSLNRDARITCVAVCTRVCFAYLCSVIDVALQQSR